jgi:hypothetical protein
LITRFPNLPRLDVKNLRHLLHYLINIITLSLKPIAAFKLLLVLGQDFFDKIGELGSDHGERLTINDVC